jgi:hypothetical protein
MTMMKVRFVFELLHTLTSSKVSLEELYRSTDRCWGK